jgi:hypothetical protein
MCGKHVCVCVCVCVFCTGHKITIVPQQLVFGAQATFCYLWVWLVHVCGMGWGEQQGHGWRIVGGRCSGQGFAQL